MDYFRAALFALAAILVLGGAWGLFDIWVGAEIDKLGEE